MRSIHEVGGPSAWRGSDIQDRTDWIVELADRQAHELLDALAAIEADGLDFFEVNRETFALPTLGPLLESFLIELLNGRCFVLAQGVPVEGLTEQQIELMYWGLGQHIGIPLPQGAAGTDLFAHVRDEGVDRNADYGGALLNKHHEALPFHTDSSDLVGLLCINPAMDGGASTIVSAAAVHDEFLRRRPDLSDVTYEQWWFERRRGQGPDSFAQCPIFAVNDKGKLFTFYGPDLFKTATRGEDVPELSDRQWEAMALIDEINGSPEFQLNMNFRSGEIQFLNNYSIMHSRSAYEDHADPALKRDLIRLWLTVDQDLGIPEEMSDRGVTARSDAFPL